VSELVNSDTRPRPTTGGSSWGDRHSGLNWRLEWDAAIAGLYCGEVTGADLDTAAACEAAVPAILPSAVCTLSFESGDQFAKIHDPENVLGGEKQIRGSGGSLEPPGSLPFFCTSTPRIWSI
jgi:hypothetical protein